MSEQFAGLDLDFSSSPIAYKFLHDDSFVRTIIGPVGCVAPETLVVTEFGPMPIWKIDRPMRVLSWNDQTGRFQLSWCGGSFPKGTDYLLQVSTPQGGFVASEHHLLYGAGRDYQRLDSYRAGDEVCGVSDGLDPTSFLVDLRSSPQDVPHSTQIAVDSLGHYAALARQYGQQLLSVEGIDLEFVPLHTDVRSLVLSGGASFASRMGDRLARLSAHIRQGLSCGLRRIGGYVSRLSPLRSVLEGQAFFGSFHLTYETSQQRRQSLGMTVCRQRDQQSSLSRPSSSLSASESPYISSRTILSVEKQAVKRSYWDMQVLDTHNYVTVDGTIHHNSGKSYASAAEVILRAVKQAPSPIDGIKYSRFVVVRNTYGELKTTTLKTWVDMFPENVFGPLRWTPPITHHIKLPPRGDAAGIDCEVIFLALDQPKDTRRLLSLELTGAWVNEGRELPKAVFDGLTHRVGRYPAKRDGGATWHGIWSDTNGFDTDHWMYTLAEVEPIKGKYAWRYFKQPPGVLEVKPEDLPEHPEANDHVFAAKKWWTINKKAENLKNLPAGYYLQQLAGKNLDWIHVYAQGRYAFVQDGRPVWPEFDGNIMVDDILAADPALPIQVGLDFGLTPAAVFGQRHPNGQWRVLRELVTFDMGLERFGSHLLAEINTHYPRHEILIWGDPAGQQRDAIYETTAFEYLRTLGLRAQPTASNDFKIRREGAAAPMNRLVMGKPGLLIDKSCKMLIKGLGGAYAFKRVAVGAGYEKFKDVPDKGMYSHVCDAFGYLCLGGGEYKHLTKNKGGMSSTFLAQTVVASDFDPFNF